MERCRLCGGQVVNGRCTECGWNNRKNDSRYHLNEHNRKSVQLHGGSCEDHLNKPETKRTTYRTTMEDSPARRKELKKRRQTGTVQKRKGRIWGLLGIIVLYGILEGWSWLDEQDIDLGDAVTRLVQYFEDDDSANDAGWMEEEDAESDEMLSVSAEKQDWDTGDAGYYEACLEPGNYTVGYDLFPGSYQLECRLDSAWIYVSDPEGTDWDYEVLYSEEYQDWVRENDEEYSGEYSAYSNVLELSEGQTLYIESVTESVWITGLKAEGAVLEKRDSQGLQTVHYQEGMEPGAGIPEGVYDLVLSNPDTGVVYLQVHGEDGMELYLTLGKDTPVIRRIFIQDGDTFEYEDYDTGAKIDFVPSY